MNLFKSMPMRGRIIAGASAFGVLIVAYFLFTLASQPSYTMLSAGIDPAQTAKVTAALDAQGISYKLANNGTALQVEASQIAKARVALAGQGITASGGSDPWAPLDKQKLGASDFQQQVAYQRALEGQIAQTVNQISGVGGATVQLTVPKDQLFADQQTPATAAVMLGAGPSSLDPGAVRGIANLVASSVQGLKPANVTITDGTGQLLWPTGDGANGGTASKPAAEARYNAALTSQLNAIVARTVGPGKAQVQVKSDLNVDQTSLDKLEYAKKGIALKQTKGTETLKGAGAAAGGVAGVGSNVPSYAGTAGAGGNSNYSHKTDATEFGVGRVVTHTKVAPGALNRLDVALVVDPSVPTAVRAQLQQAVATAAGIQKPRGDTISTSVVPFTKQPAAAAPVTQNMLGYAKYALLGLAMVLFLFFVSRHLRRRESTALLGEPVWLRQIESPRALGESHVTEIALPEAPRRELERVVARDPERAAATLRAWMEDRP